MGFYYFSLFSWMLFAIYFAVAATFIIKVCEANKLSKYWKAGLLSVAFIAPWAEELRIAYNFGQLCRKDAGKFIYKTVEVDGYYDDNAASLALVRSGRYRFIESPGNNRIGYIRLTLGDPEFARAAMDKYNQQNPRMDASKQDYIRANLDETTSALVYPRQGVSWRITKIEKPTARYHYSKDLYGVQVGHKVYRQEYRVADSVANEILGRFVVYSRRAYWFYIGLDSPSLACDGPNSRAGRLHRLLIEEEVLKPQAKS